MPWPKNRRVGEHPADSPFRNHRTDLRTGVYRQRHLKLELGLGGDYGSSPAGKICMWLASNRKQLPVAPQPNLDLTSI